MKNFLISLILCATLAGAANAAPYKKTVSRTSTYRPTNVYVFENRNTSRSTFYRFTDPKTGSRVMVYERGTKPRQKVTHYRYPAPWEKR